MRVEAPFLGNAFDDSEGFPGFPVFTGFPVFAGEGFLDLGVDLGIVFPMGVEEEEGLILGERGDCVGRGLAIAISFGP
jgi:hypothetical protein